jgi:hypothetical protein
MNERKPFLAEEFARYRMKIEEEKKKERCYLWKKKKT